MYKNKNALITGGGGLLGPEHAVALSEVGFNIVLLDIDSVNLDKKYKLLKKKIKNKRKILSYVCDISNEKEVKKVSSDLLKKKVFIDVLVNNAEINPKMNKFKTKYTGRIEDYSIDRLKKELSVGIIGTFICSKIFAEHMKIRKGGSIINISSDLGITAPDQRVYHKSELINNVRNFKPIGYSISKHAVIGITKYLSTYFAKKSIRCNTLVPGAVINNQPSFLIKNVKKRIPLNRWAKKTDYKKAIQFLATEDSSYMTGQSLIMDGGRTIW
jgi:NAD(P)-dependent dehydrogenase (short-subunit alcohol dehydrogenase family)